MSVGINLIDEESTDLLKSLLLKESRSVRSKVEVLNLLLTQGAGKILKHFLLRKVIVTRFVARLVLLI